VTLVRVGVLSALLVSGSSCVPDSLELPRPAQHWGDPPDLVVPSTPAPPAPYVPVVLSAAESAAIERLRIRGAAITVFSGSGDVLVHFPLGALEREWRKKGNSDARCGMGIEHYLIPDDTGPAMTDRDLVYLEQLPRLTRVNLAGTLVSAPAVAAYRAAHPNVIVEDRDDE
jgi:hypothetical protein